MTTLTKKDTALYDRAEADGVAEFAARLGSATALPFGMRPAPQRAPKTIGPVDLGDTDASYAGWQVVFDGDMDWGAYVALQERVSEIQARITARNASSDETPDASDDASDDETPDTSDDDTTAGVADATADATADMRAMIGVMGEMTEMMCYAWNFINPRGALLPQPREGGAALVPMPLYGVLAKAFTMATTPPKASKRTLKRRS